jgi:hypothetical protein
MRLISEIIDKFPDYDSIPNVETILDKADELYFKLSYSFDGYGGDWKDTLTHLSKISSANNIYKTAFDFLYIMKKMYASVDWSEDPKIEMVRKCLEANKEMNESVAQYQRTLNLHLSRRQVFYETSEIRDTPWAMYHYSDKIHALLHKDWDVVYNLFTNVLRASPTTVIIPALIDTIQELERQKYDWSDNGKKDEILFRERCSALLLRPIMMAFWSSLVNVHGMEVKEAFAQLLERCTRGSVVSELLNTLLGAMQFSTLPIHDREVNPMHLHGEFWSNIPQHYLAYYMPHTELNPHVGLPLSPYS